MTLWSGHFNNQRFDDPRSELKARAQQAQDIGEHHVSIPIQLIWDSLAIKECEARTIVNGNREKKLLVEVKCTRLVDPVTGKHVGPHVHGRDQWG